MILTILAVTINKFVALLYFIFFLVTLKNRNLEVIDRTFHYLAVFSSFYCNLEPSYTKMKYFTIFMEY